MQICAFDSIHCGHPETYVLKQKALVRYKLKGPLEVSNH